MKVAIVGAGAVGTACLFAMALRGSARDIVLVNRNRERARGAVNDLQYGALLAGPVRLRAGGLDDVEGASVVVLTLGINEKTGGATDRSDPAGRLRLLKANAAIYRDVVPGIVARAPEAVLLVVTDPPDPLADLTRALAGHSRVVSSGTLLDSLRFRFHLAQRLGIDAASVEANVIGEHGTSQVYLWSSARVAGTPVLPGLLPPEADVGAFRLEIEKAVRYANISIIEGTGASQLGIGVVTARIVEIMEADTQAVVPVGSYHADLGVTLSLPSQLGRAGVSRVLMPPLADEEQSALEKGADVLRRALASIGA